jgi:hypothetical protein
VGIDAQYQYVTDKHRFSAQWTSIRETQNLNANLASDNVVNHLSTDTAKLTYYYQTRYGVSVGYQRISGDTNVLLYGGGAAPVSGSANGSLDSEAYLLELNWLPWRDRRFTLQYTAYEKFNGAKDNYDGFGRNAMRFIPSKQSSLKTRFISEVEASIEVSKAIDVESKSMLSHPVVVDDSCSYRLRKIGVLRQYAPPASLVRPGRVR